MRKLFTLMVSMILVIGLVLPGFAQGPITCWFPPGWSSKASQAKEIVGALSQESQVNIRPRIAKSYPEILEAFASGEANLVYVGSFVQAIIKARQLGTPMVQSVNGKEFYSGVLVYPGEDNPKEILTQFPEKVAFAAGASSGESSAKAATSGKAQISVPNHGAACNAVMAGKARAAVVKNWWWESNREKFAGLNMYVIPGVSEKKNPDNVLTASKAVSADVQQKIAAAAIVRKDVFGAKEMRPLDPAALDFSLALMKEGQIDPLRYSW